MSNLGVEALRATNPEKRDKESPRDSTRRRRGMNVAPRLRLNRQAETRETRRDKTDQKETRQTRRDQRDQKKPDGQEKTRRTRRDQTDQ